MNDVNVDNSVFHLQAALMSLMSKTIFNAQTYMLCVIIKY